jgi:hypothetical protein
MADRIPIFVHWRNKDGSFSSVCSECLKTVSTRDKESDLEYGEEHHMCDEVIGRLIDERRPKSGS